MTLEEAMLRIQELESENASLKKKPRVWRDRFPEEILEKHPVFRKDYGGLLVDENTFSTIVRWLCFPKKKGLVRLPREKYNTFQPKKPLREQMCAIKLVDMNDFQYAKYLEAIDAILTALEPIRAEVFAAVTEE